MIIYMTRWGGGQTQKQTNKQKKNTVKINMAPLQHEWEANSNAISRSPFLPAASEKREETTWQLANTTPEKMPHVTSSAAIAPRCTSAQRWGLRGQRKGETQEETEGLDQDQGVEKNYTETLGFAKINKTNKQKKKRQQQHL